MEGLLLHVCCAPDATVPWARLRDEGYSVVPYWYGANIFPRDEERRRKSALHTLCGRMGRAPVVEGGAPSLWEEATKHLAGEPEGGRRCALCFSLQLEGAARAAQDLGIWWLCTTLTISPHKDVALINGIGREVAARHGLKWLERVFRKNDGFPQSVALSKAMGLYRQTYCGCRYSMESDESKVKRA